MRQLGRTELSCGALIGTSRHCAVRSAGMPLTVVPGSLHVIVDSANIVMLIQFRRGANDDVPPGLRDQMAREWTEEVRAISATWDSTRGASSAEKTGSSYRMQRWRTRDSSWSADVRYDSREPVAQSFTITNERALRALRAYSPLADYVLGQRELAGEATDIPQILLEALASGPAPAMPLGSPPAVELAECELELADVVIPARRNAIGGPDARSEYGKQLAAVAEAAVPIAMPGWRLVFGQHVYLVSPSGTAEQVKVRIEQDHHSLGLRDGEDVYAVAISRPSRIDSARRRIEALDTGAQCSSRGDIVFVRRGADGSLAESVRIPIDEEALLVEITRMDFVPMGDGRGALLVSYVSSHGTNGWSGDVEWRAQIATDPPRVVGRAPVSFVKKRGLEAPAEGGILLTQLGGDTLVVHTVEENGAAVSSQSVRIPLGSGKALPGSTLLQRLH